MTPAVTLRTHWVRPDPAGPLLLQRKRADSGLMIAQGEGEVTVEGHASVWGIADRGGDVVERGAFAASLARLRARGEAPKLLWQHDASQPIGVWDEAREDAHGLWVRGRILLDVAPGAEAASLVRAGAIDGLSIGYHAVKAAKDDRGRRRLVEVDLWEVSLVTFPMLPEARLSSKGAALLQILTGQVARARDRVRTA